MHALCIHLRLDSTQVFRRLLPRQGFSSIKSPYTRIRSCFNLRAFCYPEGLTRQFDLYWQSIIFFHILNDEHLFGRQKRREDCLATVIAFTIIMACSPFCSASNFIVLILTTSNFSCYFARPYAIWFRTLTIRSIRLLCYRSILNTRSSQPIGPLALLICVIPPRLSALIATYSIKHRWLPTLSNFINFCLRTLHSCSSMPAALLRNLSHARSTAFCLPIATDASKFAHELFDHGVPMSKHFPRVPLSVPTVLPFLT